MKIYILKLIFIQFFFFNFTVGEYQIKERVVPTFLNYTFYETSKEVFPNDIVIFVSLSRIGGTFLYSVDRKSCQLIVSLHNGDSLMMNLELNKQQFDVSLVKLCKCERCRYQPLKLRIQVRETLNVQCNDGDVTSFTTTKSLTLNRDYPIPTFNTTDKVEAYLWLVNTPVTEKFYPNGAQISGCIFNVTYKNVALKMGTHGVLDKCRKTCTANVCHEGQCLETYNGAPLCNCTGSFKGGVYCNDGIENQNGQMNKSLNVHAIKLAFTKTSGEFFRINNSDISLTIWTQEARLVITLQCSKLYPITIEAVISQNYRIEDENILIIEFYEKLIGVTFRGHGKSWSYISIPHYHDLSKELFKNLLLNSTRGMIDMHYINVKKDFRWIKLTSINVTNAESGQSNTMNGTVVIEMSGAVTVASSSERTKVGTNKTDPRLNISKLEKEVTACLGLTATMFTFMLISLCMVIFYIIRRRIRRRSSDPYESHTESLVKQPNGNSNHSTMA